MPASIGVNLRVTGHCRQGGRKYMEDFFSVAYQQTEDEKDLEYAFFGIYDGHGGGEAATYAKESLMESIVRQKNFWSDKDEDVLKAIKDGYIATHYAMWKEQEKWPKTASGLPSTAGTTASVAFIRRGKIYIGHVGDSGIILGYQDPGHSVWKARPLTKDHKPENANEMSRIEQCGGKVVTKSGVPRVVWNRPRIGHKGPVRRSTPIDEIPFLAVARSLGDLWSYNSALDEFVVSPDPDTCCIPIDTATFRCLIFGTDGLWNMISASAAVSIVQVAEQHNERTVLATADFGTAQQQQQSRNKVWVNPSKCLVERALERWSSTRMRADNTSVITLMLDPPGPPRAEVIKSQNRVRRSDVQPMDNVEYNAQNQDFQDQLSPDQSHMNAASPPPVYPENGLEIVTVYRDEPAPSSPPLAAPELAQSTEDTYIVPDTPPAQQQEEQPQQLQPPELPDSKVAVNEEKTEPPVKCYTEEYLDKIHREVLNTIQVNKETPPATKTDDVITAEKPPVETIQINEVSSSSSLDKPAVADETPCARCTRSHDIGRRSLRGGPAELKGAKSSRSSSESPKRKVRPTRPLVMQRNTVGGAKREHSEPETDVASGVDEARACGDGRLAAGPATNSEPPQKLRRSRSLGPTVVPKNFNARNAVDMKSGGATALGRCLRERDRTVEARHSLAAPSTTSASTFRRLNGTRSFTPVRSPMQTRNRVKRLNNK